MFNLEERGSGVLIIGIDARPLIVNQAGIRRYLLEMLRALSRLGQEHYFLMLGNKDFNIPELGENFRKVIFPGHSGVCWIQYAVPYLLSKYKVDLFWSPNYAVPLTPLGDTKCVITVHDMAAFVVPWTLPVKTLLHNRLILPLYARKVERVLTVSESAKRDIIKYLRFPPNKIHVTPLGVNESFFEGDRNHVRKIQTRYGINWPYLLCVGTIEPRKNLLRTIQAYASIVNQNVNYHRLVIVGRKGWKYRGIFKWLKENEYLSEHVAFLDSVSDADLPALYRGATCLLYPSLYEGFGLPVLEAMACGVPVITSNVSSMPEVVGDAGLLVNPHSVYEIELYIKRILTEPDLRRRLSLAGLARARKFSWDRAAMQTLEVFFEVTNGGSC